MFKSHFESENPYVLIFMDCSMEPMDGYTATKQIKDFCAERNTLAPYIVATTGHSEDEYIQKAWDSGYDELIPKPCTPALLIDVLDESMQYID